MQRDDIISHYYDKENTSNSNPKFFSVDILGNEFSFKTDNGVFAKKYLDFGSKLLIEQFIMPKTKGSILDLGCGYGVIGIIIAKIWQQKLDMIDINDRAILLSKENADNNNVPANTMQCDSICGDKKYAVILTNPPIRTGKKKVYQFFSDSYLHLLKNGELWIVIRKDQGALSAKNKLIEIFGNCVMVERKKRFYIFKCIKSID